jgi:hypothetical protein
MPLCYFHNFIIEFTFCINKQHLRISKSVMEEFRFDCRIKIRILNNSLPLCNSRPWHRHSSPYSMPYCYPTDQNGPSRTVYLEKTRRTHYDCMFMQLCRCAMQFSPAQRYNYCICAKQTRTF